MLGSDAFIFPLGEGEDVFSNCGRRDPVLRLGDVAFVGGGEVVLSKASTVLALLVA
jgi:hypothetical protein